MQTSITTKTLQMSEIENGCILERSKEKKNRDGGMNTEQGE